MKLLRCLALLLVLLPALAGAVTCTDATIPPSNPDSVYTDHGDGTVTDTRTGLMWKRCAEGQTWDGSTCTGSAATYTWQDSLAQAEGASFAGHADWRLPNPKELRSLVEECRYNPAINDSLFPNTSSSSFWSGSPDAGYWYYAWGVYFYDGRADGYYDRNLYSSVRLVRGGQSSTTEPAIVSASSFDGFNLMDVYDAGGNTKFILVATRKSSGAYFTDPDGIRAYASELYLFKIASNGQLTKLKLADFAPYGETAPHSTGDIRINGSTVYIFANSKEQNGTYAMSGYLYTVDSASMTLTNTSTVFTNANWGWFPVIQANGQISHFSFAGYYRYLDASNLGSVDPQTMESEWIADHANHAGGLVLQSEVTQINGTARATVISRILASYQSADTVPDVFSFPAQTGVAQSTQITSDTVTITGIDSAAAIAISGGEYRIDGGAWTSTAGTIGNNQTVEVRVTSASTAGQQTSATLTVGGVQATFTVTTASATPAEFSFDPVTGIAAGAWAVSSPITISGLSSAAPISIENGAYRIDGGAWTSLAGTVQNGASVEVRVQSGDASLAVEVATLTVGTVSASFAAVTAMAATDGVNRDLTRIDYTNHTLMLYVGSATNFGKAVVKRGGETVCEPTRDQFFLTADGYRYICPLPANTSDYLLTVSLFVDVAQGGSPRWVESAQNRTVLVHDPLRHADNAIGTGHPIAIARKLRDTRASSDQLTNAFVGTQERQAVGDEITHRILDFDKVVGLSGINATWAGTAYAGSAKPNRTPLLLIHGWQGGSDMQGPQPLGLRDNSELHYWQHFLDYYLATPALQEKYHVYLYHYSSYKHITYNADVLKSLLSDGALGGDLARGAQDGSLVLLAHSMGGLVSRAMIEEHGFSAYKRLITLDTPHHGSTAALKDMPDVTDFQGLAKDLNTAGATDLHWDNFDSRLDTAGVIVNNDFRWGTLGQEIFDMTYRDRLISACGAQTTPNPWLRWLNCRFDTNSASYRDKYVLYVGWVGADRVVEFVENNDFYLAALQISLHGYESGAAEPVGSAFLAKEATDQIFHPRNNQVTYLAMESVTPSFLAVTASEDTDVRQYIGDGRSLMLIDGAEPGPNNGHPYGLAYRRLWDYDHEQMVNGAYSHGPWFLGGGGCVPGDWDRYISAGITLAGDRECSAFVKYQDRYVNAALYITGKATLSIGDVERLNPLRTEPLFVLLEKDLLSAATVVSSGQPPTTPSPATDTSTSTTASVTTIATNVSVQAHSGETLSIASVDAAGANIHLPATIATPVTIQVGGQSLQIANTGSDAILAVRSVTINGVQTPVLTVTRGSVSFADVPAQAPLIALSNGQYVSAGDSGSAATVTQNASTGQTIIAVSAGFVVLPSGTFSNRSTRNASTPPEVRVYAGEIATFSDTGALNGIRLGSLTGDAAGDALTLDLPENLAIATNVPNLAATAARLGGPVQTAIAAAAGGTLASGQSGGIVGIDLAGERLYLLPLGAVDIDTERADGVTLDADGMATVSASGVGVRFAPSFASLSRFAADLAQVLPGVQIAVKENGGITATVSGVAYAVRAGWTGAVGAQDGFGSDADGRLTYTQNLRVRTLYPAFVDHARLAAAVEATLPGASVQTNADGTVTVSLGEARYTLTPTYLLETAPAGTALWWVGDDGKPRLRNTDGTMQEFRIE